MKKLFPEVSHKNVFEQTSTIVHQTHVRMADGAKIWWMTFPAPVLKDTPGKHAVSVIRFSLSYRKWWSETLCALKSGHFEGLTYLFNKKIEKCIQIFAPKFSIGWIFFASKQVCKNVMEKYGFCVFLHCTWTLGFLKKTCCNKNLWCVIGKV